MPWRVKEKVAARYRRSAFDRSEPAAYCRLGLAVSALTGRGRVTFDSNF
jgi:hypothetical protein